MPSHLAFLIDKEHIDAHGIDFRIIRVFPSSAHSSRLTRVSCI
jgi:hypothetical protein